VGTPCQAFSVGAHVLGLQFHGEFQGARIEAWLSGHAVELARAQANLAWLRADTLLYADDLERAGTAVLGRWLDGLSR